MLAGFLRGHRHLQAGFILPRDAATLTLPDKQDDLVSAVAAANAHTIAAVRVWPRVVLHHLCVFRAARYGGGPQRDRIFDGEEYRQARRQGNRAGIRDASGEPPKRLIGWQMVELAAGESKTVNITIDPLYLSVFNEGKSSFEVAGGDYKIWAGGSSRSLPLSQAVAIGN